MNDFIQWPDDWPKYYNGRNEPCDMLIGPCGCGAWHHPDEFLSVTNRGAAAWG